MPASKSFFSASYRVGSGNDGAIHKARRGTRDDLIRLRQTLGDLQCWAEIAINCNVSDLDSSIRTDDADSGFSRAEEQCSGWDRKGTLVTIDLQSDLNIGTREEFACLVRYFQFRQQSFGGWIDRSGRSYNPCRIFSRPDPSDCQVGLGTYLHKFRQWLRHFNVYPQRRNP